MEELISGLVQLVILLVQLIISAVQVTLYSLECIFHALSGILRRTDCAEIRRSQRRCVVTLLSGLACIVMPFALNRFVPFGVGMAILTVGVGLLFVSAILGNYAENLVMKEHKTNKENI